MSRERLQPVGLVAVAVVAVALVVWAAIGDDGEDGGTTAAEGVPAEAAEQIDAGELAAKAAELGHPLYWIGPLQGSGLELTEDEAGDVFLRYRGAGEEGASTDELLTVGTYPVDDPRAAVERAAGEAGVELHRVPGGGVAFAGTNGRRSAYVAFPGSEFQVEVYDPVPGRALDLVLSGEVEAAG